MSIQASVRFLATAFFILMIAPVVGDFFVELARENGAYEKPTERVNAVVEWAQSLFGQGFHWLVFFSGGLAIGMWLDTFLARKEQREHAGTSLLSDDPATDPRIHELELQISNIEAREKRKKEIAARLEDIASVEEMLETQIPYCWNAAENVQSHFSMIMQKIDDSKAYQFLSSRDHGLRELDFALENWRDRLYSVSLNSEKWPFQKDLFDYSSYSRDPLQSAQEEPYGLTQDLQSKYRKFAAQRDNLKSLEGDLPGRIAEEKEQLLADAKA